MMPAMEELKEALERFGGNAAALARAIGVTPDRIRVWRFRGKTGGKVPEPWPRILRAAKPAAKPKKAV